MKRSPIARRTPLKRGTKQLKRSPIRRRSKKTQKLYTDKRIPFVERLLSERPNCEAGTSVCTGRSVDIHEPKQRSALGSILDEENTMSVCRLCHGWIHEHPRISGERSWLINKWTP